MKVEGWLFLGCAAFFGGADILYWYYSKDPTGTAALAFAVGLAILTGFYVLFTGRRPPGRPESNPQSAIAEAFGEVGFFAAFRWWPLLAGFSCSVVAFCLAISWWLFLIA